MSLKLKLDTLDGLDAGVAALYKKGEDDKFHLDAEGLGDIQAALKQANKEAADRRKALERYKDIDPDRYAELLKAEEDRATKDAEAKGKWPELKEAMAKKHEAELGAERTKSANLFKALEGRLVDAEVTAAITAAGGVPQLLLPHVRAAVKLVQAEDGTFSVQVVNDDGSPKVVNGSGKAATIADLVEEKKADPIFGRAFEGSKASGGGAHKPGGAVGKVLTETAFLSLNPKERAAFMAEGGELKA